MNRGKYKLGQNPVFHTNIFELNEDMCGIDLTISLFDERQRKAEVC